jgi:hypothetical protein
MRRVAVAMVALLAFTVFDLSEAPSAVATQGLGTSLAGSYTASIYTKHGFVVPTGPLTLTRSGRFSFAFKGGGDKGMWAETANVVTLTATGRNALGTVYTAHVVGTNLGSTGHPGKVTMQGRRVSKWHATRN